MNNKEALEQAIKLTDEILVVLQDQNLSKIDILEAQRQFCIDQAFSSLVGKIDLIKSMHLLKLNQEVVEKLIVLKISIRHQQQTVSNAGKATKAYQKNY